MDDNELEVVCEFDFFDEVRSLFLLLVKEQVTELFNCLRETISDKPYCLVESLADTVGRVVDCLNVKESKC